MHSSFPCRSDTVGGLCSRHSRAGLTLGGLCSRHLRAGLTMWWTMLSSLSLWVHVLCTRGMAVWLSGWAGPALGSKQDENTLPGSCKQDENTLPGSCKQDENTLPGSCKQDENTLPGSCMHFSKAESLSFVFTSIHHSRRKPGCLLTILRRNSPPPLFFSLSHPHTPTHTPTPTHTHTHTHTHTRARARARASEETIRT